MQLSSHLGYDATGTPGFWGVGCGGYFAILLCHSTQAVRWDGVHQ